MSHSMHTKPKCRTLLLLLAATMLMCCSAVRAEIFFIHNDHLGTPRAMTDKTGAVVWKAKYDPFGKATITKTPSTYTPNPPDLNLRFPGQYYDAETGLHYNYYRDYDPQTGRYLQPDPIGLDGGPNPYTYANNNPLRFTDPLGLCPPGDVMCNIGQRNAGLPPDPPPARMNWKCLSICGAVKPALGQGGAFAVEKGAPLLAKSSSSFVRGIGGYAARGAALFSTPIGIAAGLLGASDFCIRRCMEPLSECPPTGENNQSE